MTKYQKSLIMRSAQVLLNILIAFLLFYDKMGMADKDSLTGVKGLVFFSIPQLTILEMFWERRSTKLSRQRYFLGWWIGAFVVENIAFWLLPFGKFGHMLMTIGICFLEVIFSIGIFKGRYSLPTGVSLFQIAFAVFTANNVFQLLVQNGAPTEGIDIKTWVATKVFIATLLPLTVTWIQTHNKSGIGVDIFLGLFISLLVSVAWCISVEDVNQSTAYEFYFSVGLGALVYLGYLSVAGKPTKLLDLLKAAVPACTAEEEEREEI